MFFFFRCRNTQAVFDKCMLDKLGIERPDYGYYLRPKVHDTKRPKPKHFDPEFKKAYDQLPADYERKPSAYPKREFFSE